MLLISIDPLQAAYERVSTKYRQYLFEQHVVVVLNRKKTVVYIMALRN